MKIKKLLTLFVATLVTSLSLFAFPGSAQACGGGCDCRVVPAHYEYGIWVHKQVFCTRDAVYECKWFKGYKRHGVYHPAHKVCKYFCN